MLDRIVSYYRENGIKGVLHHAGNFLRHLLTPMYMTILESIGKPERKVVFCNFAGKGYGGYPKSICDELIRRKSDAKLVWLVKDHSDLPAPVKAVPIESFAALRELATARVWIDNCRKSQLMRKGKKQFYLQTWHGGGPCLKMIEGDAAEYLSDSYIRDARNDTEMADLFVSDCEWQNDNYRRAFWYNGEILECTTPSNDAFYKDWEQVRAKVCKTLDIDPRKHIVLYAPTFRNNHDVSCYDIDYGRILQALEDRFGGEWVFVIRIHPTMMEKYSEMRFDDRVINGTLYPEIEELLIASDMLITDFSASMFLAYRWKIATLLYASDLDDYLSRERPLYFDVHEMPASFSSNNEALIDAINGFSKPEYDERCEAFSKQVGFFEGGHAVETITDRIERELNR